MTRGLAGSLGGAYDNNDMVETLTVHQFAIMSLPGGPLYRESPWGQARGRGGFLIRGRQRIAPARE